jgi:hypothetical protein
MILERPWRDIRESFTKFAEKTGDSPDKIAKGPDFVTFLLERVYPAATTVL